MCGNLGDGWAITVHCLQRQLGGAVGSIARERIKQRSKYCFDDAHDDAYRAEELVCAALNIIMDDFNCTLVRWPWSADWRKRVMAHDRKQQLVIAASLLAAEIDRMDRTKP